MSYWCWGDEENETKNLVNSHVTKWQKARHFQKTGQTIGKLKKNPLEVK